MEPKTDTTTVTIEASAESVWRLLADDFLGNAAWAPGVISSAQNPATPDGVNGSRFGGRVSEIEGLGQADVRIVDFDGPTKMLSYTLAAQNVPPFMEKIQNTWIVTPVLDGTCTVSSKIDITIASSAPESENISKAINGMFGQIAAAMVALKTYVEANPEFGKN